MEEYVLLEKTFGLKLVYIADSLFRHFYTWNINVSDILDRLEYFGNL